MDKALMRGVLLSQDTRTRTDAMPRLMKNKIEQYRDSPFVIVISGIRRCGKSTLLQMTMGEGSYYVNFDDDRFVGFSIGDFDNLLDVLVELHGERNEFLFDEIQNIAGWEMFVRRLHDEGKKVFITGSNATMLSKELGTHLTGRNIMLSLFPFSFGEFLTYTGRYVTDISKLTSTGKSLMTRHLIEYLERGGFPEYLATGKIEYLQSLYRDIIYRDIIHRYGLPSEKPLKETAQFAASNIGKEISYNSIRRMTGLSSATTIREYFEYLENSYLLFMVPRYDPSVKSQIYYNKKVYFIDTALADTVGFRPSRDVGRMLENAVFIALRRNHEEIYFHRGKGECDFLVREKGKVSDAIQVTAELENSRRREIEGLIDAMDAYGLKTGLILTLSEEETVNVGKKTIFIRPAWKWLLEAEEITRP